MQFTKDRIDEFKTMWKEVYGADLSYEEAQEYASKLVGFVGLLMDGAEKIHRWDEKLKEFPNGYLLPDDGIYNCLICHDQVSGQTGWYDQFGIKCMPCQQAVESDVIPGSICRERDSWFSTLDLQTKFDLHPATVKKMIRKGELKPRVIERNGHAHFYVFLKSENNFKQE